MKYYVITESELKEYFKPKLTFYEKIITDFLKDKKPVELVANGEVGYIKIRPEYQILDIGGATFNGVIREIIETKYKGKNINIYIQEK